MRWKNFAYYGFDKETYDSVKDLRDQTNRKHTEIITSLFLILMIALVVLSMLSIVTYAHRAMYIEFSIASAVFTVIILIARKFTTKHATIFMYILVAIMLFFSIESSISDTFQIGIIFPVFVTMIGVSFIDNMPRFSLVLVGFWILFTVYSYLRKPPSIAFKDLLFGTVFTFVALLFHFRFSRNRIEQFLAYHRNLQIQRDLIISSSFDSLSELLVRARFFSMADTVLRGRQDDHYIALCIVDLDEFKKINDCFGHQMGDKAIQTAGKIIWETLEEDISEKWSFCERAVLEGKSFAGRLGGDEFVIFLRTDSDWEAVHDRLQKILDSLNSVELGEMHGIHASLGVVEFGSDEKDIDEAYTRADRVLYEAKKSGKNQIVKG